MNLLLFLEKERECGSFFSEFHLNLFSEFGMYEQSNVDNTKFK